jgi:glycosyltransferase involved in cell wall biosynthesis
MSLIHNSVTHIITTIDRGGAEKQLLALCKFQVAQGLTVTVIPLKGRLELIDDFLVLGVFVDTSYANLHPAIQAIKIHLLLRKTENSFLHAHLPRAEILSSLASMFTKQWRILSKHNSEPFLTKGPRIFSIILAKIVFFRAHKVICISYFVRDYLESIGEIPSNSSKVHVIHYGFDFSIQPRVLASKNPPRGSKNKSLTIGTVSRLTHQKDLYTLITSFSIVLQKKPDARLKIVGVGKLEFELKKYAESIGASYAIHWLGSQADPYCAMGEVDVFVLSSRYEGFGLVLLEWVCRNRPIIASNIPPFEEILGDEYPLFCEVGNTKAFAEKILLASSTGLTAEVFRVYEEIRDKFDYRNMGEEIVRLYHEISATN